MALCSSDDRRQGERAAISQYIDLVLESTSDHVADLSHGIPCFRSGLIHVDPEHPRGHVLRSLCAAAHRQNASQRPSEAYYRSKIETVFSARRRWNFNATGQNEFKDFLHRQFEDREPVFASRLRC